MMMMMMMMMNFIHVSMYLADANWGHNIKIKLIMLSLSSALISSTQSNIPVTSPICIQNGGQGRGEDRVLTKILVYSCFIGPFICLFVTMNWEVP